MKISVFGAANAKAGEQPYQDAYLLGKLLGDCKHTVLTGGYIGMMEAVSRGANEAGAHVIGVTCDEIESWRQIRPNEWVKEEWRLPTLHERLIALLDGCDAAIALPGGVGTLAEILMMWNRLVIHSSQPKPCIIIGTAWQNVFNSLHANLGLYIKVSDWDWLQFVPDVQSAAQKFYTSQPEKPAEIA